MKITLKNKYAFINFIVTFCEMFIYLVCKQSCNKNRTHHFLTNFCCN